jgi:hypothetical protein
MCPSLSWTRPRFVGTNGPVVVESFEEAVRQLDRVGFFVSNVRFRECKTAQICSAK